MRFLRLTGAAFALVLGCGCEHATAATTAWIGDGHAAARLIAASDAVGSAATVAAGLEIRLAPGWHAYWRSPGDAGIPPSIDFAGSANLARARIAWPAPTRYSLQGLETAGYAQDVVLPIRLTPMRPGQPLALDAAVDYAACAEICVPYSAKLKLALPAGPAAPAPEAVLIAAAEARVPHDLAAAGLHLLSANVSLDGHETVLTLRLRTANPLRAPDLFVEGLTRGSPGQPRAALREAGHLARLTVPLRGADMAAAVGRMLTLTLVDGNRAAQFQAVPVAAPVTARLLPILAIALLGGLILNVMPCVLPVVSLKLLSLAGQAGIDRRRARLGLLMTALGVLASFAALAALLITLDLAGAAIGWGIQFQWPWFVAGMAALTTLFAASLWGWLPITLPRPLYDAVGGLGARRPYGEAFATGAFATLLATPCSAPFVGTAVGFALAGGPRDIAAVFAAMSVGLAAPYLLAAAVPAAAAVLPRPGRWFGPLRGILGLALSATALWLLFVLAALSGRAVALGCGAALVVVLGLLALHSRRRLPLPAARLVAAAAAGLVAGAVLWPAFAGIEEIRPVAAGHWQPFDDADIHRLVAEGKTVFVDVSAAWCLTCKVNEAVVLDRPPVADRLFASPVVAMRGDWTRPDPSLARYLHGFGRYGIPFDAVYGPGRPEGAALPELLSADAVLRALAQAAGDPQDAAARSAAR